MLVLFGYYYVDPIILYVIGNKQRSFRSEKLFDRNSQRRLQIEDEVE